MVNIENIVDSGQVFVQNRVKVYTLDWETNLSYARHPEDYEASDGVPLTAPTSMGTFAGKMLSYTPVNYYRLNEASGTVAVEEITPGSYNGEYNVNANTIIRTGPIYTETTSGKTLSHGNYVRSLNGLNLPLNTVVPLTINFFFMYSGTRSNDLDGLMGFYDNTQGFRIGFSGSNFVLIRSNSSERFTSEGYVMPKDEWHLYSITISATGLLKFYVDGLLVKTQQFTDNLGIKTPSVSGTDFLIGRAPSLDDIPNHGYAEVSIFNKVLTQSEIFEAYILAIANRGVTVYNGDSVNPDIPTDYQPDYVPVTDAGVDITEYVEDWTISRSVDAPVSSATLTLVEGWTSTTIATYLKAMRYVTIEQRYYSATGLDSGYIHLGKFFVDGPVADNIQANGGNEKLVSLKGVLKLLTHQDANYPVAPDIIKIPRVEAVQVAATADIVSYRVVRPGTSEYYYNFTDTPGVRMWSSEFTTTGDIWRSGDVFPIKSNEGAIQVLGGLGQINISRSLFDGKIKEGGLGAPSKIEIETYRFASPEDLILATVTATGTASNKSFITATTSFDISTVNFANRTVAIKDVAGTKQHYFKIISSEVLAPTSIKMYVVDLDAFSYAIDWTEYGASLVGVKLQITDCNLVEDAVTKILSRRGFQRKNSSTPLFYDVSKPEISVLARPAYTTADSQIKDDQLLKEILTDAPPNYYVYDDENGVVQGKSIRQKSLEDHDITNSVMSVTVDSSDYGVISRLRVIGESGLNYNVGLHSDYGGNLVSGAFKLTDVYGLGTVSQSTMDGYIKNIFDLDSTTPKIGTNLPFDYGVLYEKKDPDISDVNFFTFADENLFWFDIGENQATGNPWVIEDMEVTSFSSYRNGEIIPQSLRFYYLTKSDYTVLTGHVPPNDPSTAYSTIATNLRTHQNSTLWKPLVDEIQTSEGVAKVNKSDFSWPQKENPRFFRVAVGQPWFRYKRGGDESNTARIIITNIKLWIDRTIVQTAELGIDSGFASAELKAIAGRLRPRHDSRERNVTLTTPGAVKQYGLQELKETFSDFEPVTFNCIHTMATLHDTIRYVNPKTAISNNYLVRSVQRNMKGDVTLQAVDYTRIED